MCGISGVGGSRAVAEMELVAMRDSLAHRGPDDAAHVMSPGVALASRRLAILDLSSRGRMPMSTPDGRYCITYNGAVYNFRELRSFLEGRGHTFRTQTDTEVILQLYAEEGPAMLGRLNGMFALAIWDARERSLFLARDRLGVKPLFYAEHDGRLYFASEQKALFAAGVPIRFDPAAWEELLCFRYVSGTKTPYSGVEKLLPGHYMIWKDGHTAIHRWWILADRARSLRDSLPADPVRWYRETLDSAVDLRCISDVPVGVLLSGGLDSSSIASSLAQHERSGLASFTVRFSESGYDEGPLAREVASRFGLEYNETTVGTDLLVDRILEASHLNDEPLAHDSDLHLLAISRYARPRVTVLLSGEGADETLGGYVRYRPLRSPQLLAVARPVYPAAAMLFGAGGRLRKLARFLDLGGLRSYILYNACNVLPCDLRALGMTPTCDFPYRQAVLEEAETLYPTEPVRQAMYADQHTFLCSVLDRNDRMTMGASIECRVPFLDYRLVEALAAMPSSVLGPGRRGKPLLQRSMSDRLPPAVRHNRKWGFGVPWGSYLRDCPPLRGLVQDLPDLEPIRSGPLDRGRLATAIREFLAGDEAHVALVRQLVMIAAWHRACVKS
ncbi:MAG TPA: asparagine synthase (glutamine-hydrolyzing) [Candidatus Polarisedimenticolia bacterium]|jgi:asparagine synthase (glutamine-hydrolysing)|nr:asparagine synthase (glutamine-hydrolyzing) [Candidatus Polarisedimenticolia bacterium]